MDITKDLFHSTIRIVCSKGDCTSIGTGFFFAFNVNNSGVYTIITNKHVVKNSDFTTLYFKYQTDTCDEFKDATIKFSSKLWIPHPMKLDLAMLRLNDIADKINEHFETNKIPLYIRWFCEDLIPNSEKAKTLNYIEDILVIGYPDGKYDKFNKLPIAKRGITATPCMLDFNSNPEFLIDSAIYPGSSGSPVIIYNPSSYIENGVYKVGTRLMLIGINHSTYLSSAFKNNQANDEIQVPSNLGICTNASRLLDFKSLLQS